MLEYLAARGSALQMIPPKKLDYEVFPIVESAMSRSHKILQTSAFFGDSTFFVCLSNAPDLLPLRFLCDLSGLDLEATFCEESVLFPATVSPLIKTPLLRDI